MLLHTVKKNKVTRGHNGIEDQHQVLPRTASYHRREERNLVMTVGQLVPAYPGHGGEPTPIGGPRVKTEGEPNYVKNQGTVKQKVRIAA